VDPLILLGIFVVGLFAGCRSLTPPAVVAYAAHEKVLDLHGSPFSWLGAAPVAYALAAFAVFELIGDKLPMTPSRRAPGPFAFRIVTGSFCGAALASATHGNLAVGILLGVLGAAAGTLGGYEIRSRLVTRLKCPDWPVALAEDLVTVGGSIAIITVLIAGAKVA
jgi:uncharacterized membrane protein